MFRELLLSVVGCFSLDVSCKQGDFSLVIAKRWEPKTTLFALQIDASLSKILICFVLDAMSTLLGPY